MKDRKIKGVTLIALAVTIIVMLILAGVTISTLIGNSGITTQAQKAKFKNIAGQVREIISTEIAAINADEQINNKEFTVEEKKERIINALNQKGYCNGKNKDAKLNASKTLVIINEDNVISLLTSEEAVKGEEGLWDWGADTDTKVANKEVGICGYNGNEEEITIPEYIVYKHEVYTVTEIQNCNAGHDNIYKLKSDNTPTDHKFKSNNIVKKIKMLNNITLIAGGTFSENKSIESVEMSDNMQEFNGGAAFFGCSKLKSCKLSNSIKIIPANLFQNCTLLEEVNIPESTIEIGESAFSGVNSIEKLVIPGNVKKIGTNAFWNMGFAENSKLKEIVINEGVEEIGEQAFGRENSVNVDLHLPSTIKREKIGKNAFAEFGKRNVKKVYLFDGTKLSNGWE